MECKVLELWQPHIRMSSGFFSEKMIFYSFIEKFVLNTWTHLTFEWSLLFRDRAAFILLQCKISVENKTKQKNTRKIIFLHLSPFPGIGYIQKDSQTTTRKAFYWNLKTGTNQNLSVTSWEKTSSKFSSLKNLNWSFELEVIQCIKKKF